MERRVTAGAALLAALSFCGLLRADSVLLADGRFFEVPRVRPGAESVVLEYENGEVMLPKEMVRDFFVLQEGGEFEPRNEEEAAKLAKGLVPFEGRWVNRSHRDREVQRRTKARLEAFEELRSHQLWRNRYTESSKHFDFEYTVPQEVAAGYIEMFEVYYATFAREWSVKQTSKDGKLKVCFYNNEDDFQRIGNVPSGVLGYYRFVEPKELNFFYERQDERLTLDVLFHETNHYLFDLLTEQNFVLPAWINEGMAEYYGASDWDADKKKMSIGHLQEGRLVNLIDAMDGDDYQDLTDLMATPRIDALQYAWAWSLCHLLMEDKSTAKRFKDYIKKIARDKRMHRVRWPASPAFEWPPPQDALKLFQKTLKIDDLEAFEQSWYDYVRDFEVTTARGYHDAALFCMQWNRPVRASLYFRKSIELGSTNPATYENAGRVLRQRDLLQESVEVLQRGIEIDPLNAYLYLELGRTLVRMGGENEPRGQKLQKLAAEIDPMDNRLLWWVIE